MSIERVGDKLLLGVNTTIIAMGIVFIVLILLAVLIVIQSRILKVLSDIAERKEAKETRLSNDYEETPKASKQETKMLVQKGSTKGEMELLGVEEEEHVAAIMAAVSTTTNIPVSALRIKSIKRIDNAWENARRAEQVNQRL